MKKELKIFHYPRKHLFVLYHAKFHGNSPKNHKVTVIYTLGTLNIPLILFSMKEFQQSGASFIGELSLLHNLKFFAWKLWPRIGCIFN